VDCWALGEAQYAGCKAKILAPVPGYDYSSLNHQKILDAYNRKNKK
jgi:hypothetical protein